MLYWTFPILTDPKTKETTYSETKSFTVYTFFSNNLITVAIFLLMNAQLSPNWQSSIFTKVKKLFKISYIMHNIITSDIFFQDFKLIHFFNKSEFSNLSNNSWRFKGVYKSPAQIGFKLNKYELLRVGWGMAGMKITFSIVHSNSMADSCH